MINELPPHQIYAVAAVLLFCIGLHGLVTQAQLLRKIIAINIMGGGVFLLLISVARRNWSESGDPVPQAMVLTGIVVALSATAFAIALARRLAQATREADLEEEEEEESNVPP
jgi:multicomponent Na+:H+ antiporter subunit C